MHARSSSRGVVRHGVTRRSLAIVALHLPRWWACGDDVWPKGCGSHKFSGCMRLGLHEAMHDRRLTDFSLQCLSLLEHFPMLKHFSTRITRTLSLAKRKLIAW